MVMHLAEWHCFIRNERLPHMIEEGAHLKPSPEVDEFNQRTIDKDETMDFPTLVTRPVDEPCRGWQLPDLGQRDTAFYTDDKDMTMRPYFGESH